MRHPKKEGVFVSANDPAIIESQVIGKVFNAAFKDNAFVAELWVDVAKCTLLGGDALTVLERMDAGMAGADSAGPRLRIRRHR